MKKLLSAILLMLFSIHAYAKPLYVRLESDGDLIFSNTPILDVYKPETSLKKKTDVTEVTKENVNYSSKINTKSIPLEVAKEHANNQHNLKVIPISLPNDVPIIATITEEKIHASQQSKKTSSLSKDMPTITEATKENINNKQESKVIHMSLPNNIPIIAAATEENLHVTHKRDLNTKPPTPTENKSLFAETTEEKNNILKLNSEKKAILRPKNKLVIVEIAEENLNKTHQFSKTKDMNILKNNSSVAKITKVNIQKDHKSNSKTKIFTLAKDKPMVTKVAKETINNNTHKLNAKSKIATLSKNKLSIAKITHEAINNTHKPNAKTKLTDIPKNKPMIAKIKKENINKKPQSNSINTELTYKTFRITSPLNKEVLQNLSSILVDLKVEPKLQRDHRIQLFIDGKRMSKASNSTHINTDITKKGPHEIYGLIIDKNKNFIIQSNVITVYIREADMQTSHATHVVPHKIAKKTSIRKTSLANNH